MKTKLIISIILSVLFVNTVQAVNELTIQERLTILERQMAQPQNNRNNVADVVIQVQTLQQQIAELKGVIEEQIHQINSLKEKQKLLYVDIDSRLAELETNNTNPNNTTTSNTSNAGNSSNLGTTNSTNQPLTVEVDEGYNGGVTTQSIEEPVLTSDEDEYDIAFAHLRAGRFLESARAFEDFIQKYPNNDLTDNAYYWLGESYYVKRQYPQALAAFQTLTEKFPTSSKAADSLLKIGYSYYAVSYTHLTLPTICSV